MCALPHPPATKFGLARGFKRIHVNCDVCLGQTHIDRGLWLFSLSCRCFLTSLQCTKCDTEMCHESERI